MRKLITIIIIVSMAGQCLVQLGILGWYELNKQYIANNLCENRSKPKMHCNGKCYLMKKMKKAEQEESKDRNNSAKSESFQLVSFIIPSSWQPFHHTLFNTEEQLGHYIPSLGSDPLINIFHPPQPLV